MEYYIWGAFILCITIILSLIGVVYNSLVNMVNHTKELVGKKVDREVCDVLVKSERDAFASLRDAIKDLREYNENSHKVILDEIRKSK